MISAVVLAAGMSRRMGRLKQLLAYGGHTVIEQVVMILLTSPLNEVVVITGYERDRVEAVLKHWPVRAVYNPAYAAGGMLSSLQLGLRSVATHSRATLLVLGDMPALESDVVDQLVQSYQSTEEEAVHIPSYRMRAGHPVLIPRYYWKAILELPAGANVRSVLRGPDTRIVWVEVNTPSILQDLDTPEDYRRGLQKLNDDRV